ncbi:MAG: helix-turn-helix transcriptional regulator [Nanobdellota archaeon]
MKIYLYILLFLFFPQLVLGMETHDISYSIDDDVINVKHALEIENRTELEFQLPEDAYFFSVSVDNKTVDYSLVQANTYKLLKIPLRQTNNKVRVLYSTSAFLDKGKNSYFSGYITPVKTDLLSIDLSLPRKALVARPVDSVNPPIMPKPFTINTNGRQIVITWKETNPKDTFSIFVAYEEENSFSWGSFLSATIIIVVFFGYVYFRKTKIKSFRKNSFSHLLDPEEKVVNVLLKSNEHVMWQKELQIATGFTKSKLSRTVRNMEERGILKKIPYGSTNKIKLIEESNKEEENK